ncbi:LexA family transcriptional regulator [Mycobacterium sp. KBS0706]|uniref:XRE family transcriptional regulator n=1 Tax=Mycobacterium sp. KBS0706 TaxID=2578109 RepID=UPI00110FF583|nr:LexA family transcriptional regulator [Mycobacterium sp. KBS0706]TSD85987.1 LexA family transcriptional regulator [Mycobacterium sp. KBS0706]
MVADRLRQLREALGKTQKSMSDALQLGESSWQRLELTGSLPSGDTLQRLIELGCSANWILAGQGEMFTAHAPAAAATLPMAPIDGRAYGLSLGAVPILVPATTPAGLAAFGLDDEPGKVYVRLPLYAPRASAGPGLAVRHEGLSADLLFDAEFLWRTLRRPPEVLICMQAHGDSMHPKISHGDVLIIDTSVERVKDHGIYCFSYEGDLMVKRLYRDLQTQALKIVSDNSNYPAQELPANEANRINVVGLVVWHGGLAR